MNGRIVGSKPLYVALAQRKEDRKAHLASQYMQRMANMRMQHMGQIFQPGGNGGYYVPTLPQPQRFFSKQVSQIRTTPGWFRANANQNAVAANAAGGAYPAMAAATAGNQYRQAANVRGNQQQAPNAQAAQAASAAAMRNSARPITGQQAGGNMQARPVAPQMAANQARAANYKYTQNMRNPPAQAVPMAAQPVAQQAVHVKGQEPLTASMLAAAQPAEQKQMLGERLFPLIEPLYPSIAGKITGMLLEIDNSELVHMLEHSESLKAKVDEAVAVLHAHQQKTQQQ